MDDEGRRKAGRATRSAVLGEAHVARSEASSNAFKADFVDFLTRYAWGDVWTRPGLARRERSLITLALLVAGSRWEELPLHLRGALNNGVSVEEIKEVLLHAAVYAGVPAANTAFQIANEILTKEGRLG
jgi:4-carboxymuconolactone decarboxylase